MKLVLHHQLMKLCDIPLPTTDTNIAWVTNDESTIQGHKHLTSVMKVMKCYHLLTQTSQRLDKTALTIHWNNHTCRTKLPLHTDHQHKHDTGVTNLPLHPSILTLRWTSVCRSSISFRSTSAWELSSSSCRQIIIMMQACTTPVIYFWLELTRNNC